MSFNLSFELVCWRRDGLKQLQLLKRMIEKDFKYMQCFMNGSHVNVSITGTFQEDDFANEHRPIHWMITMWCSKYYDTSTLSMTLHHCKCGCLKYDHLMSFPSNSTQPLYKTAKHCVKSRKELGTKSLPYIQYEQLPIAHCVVWQSSSLFREASSLLFFISCLVAGFNGHRWAFGW